LEAEDITIVDPNAFKNPITVQEPVVEHRDPRFLRGHKMPIHIHLHDISLSRKNVWPSLPLSTGRRMVLQP
jgi:hypothetical protein